MLWDGASDLLISGKEDIVGEYFQNRLPRGVASGAMLSVSLREEILGDLAARMLMQKIMTSPLEDWLDDLGTARKGYDPHAIVADLRSVPLLAVQLDSVGFTHKTFMVFAAPIISSEIPTA